MPATTLPDPKVQKEIGELVAAYLEPGKTRLDRGRLVGKMHLVDHDQLGLWAAAHADGSQEERRCAERLAGIASRAVEDLAATIAAAQEHIRNCGPGVDRGLHGAVEGLHLYNAPATERRLVEMARNPDSEQRAAVAAVLAIRATQANSGNPHRLDAVLRRLSRDSDELVRRWATYGLGYVWDVDDSVGTAHALNARLGDSSREVRLWAILGLARQYEPAVVGHLLTELGSGDGDGRLIEAAAEIKDPRLVEPLRRMLASGIGDAGLLEKAITACDR